MRLEAELKRLEGEYNMFFSGRLARPPWDTRRRVETAVRRLDRVYFQNYGDRFRFSTLQSRFSSLVDLWDRSLRAREEGRAGPFVPKRAETPAVAEERPKDRTVRVASFRDPAHETERMKDLYNALVEARREIGQQAIPFQRFADLVKTQVDKLRQTDTSEVAFRVAVKDGKVSLTARVMKEG